MQENKGQRHCIECGKAARKVELLRVVKSPRGLVDFDESGKAAGRGAYVCSKQCLDLALAHKKFDRALKTSLTKEDQARIRASYEATQKGTI
ncbi:MAG: YlxR family protein [Eggerthellaceae bacterium]|jgi:predicted RNA-binding protein YlxR (DUF448 family)